MQLPAVEKIVIGQRVYTILYGRGYGAVYAIHGEQSPDSIRNIGGVIAMGGNAELDIVFEDGSESRRLPECILRGVQWRIHPEVYSEDEINALRGHAILVQTEKADRAAAARQERDEQIAALKVNPEYAHLQQGSDEYSGKLAAANIRRELKLAFPDVKISVRKDHYGSVTIVIPHGSKIVADVREVAKKYQSASFDGMQDLEELNAGPWHVVFGGAKYISVQEEWR